MATFTLTSDRIPDGTSVSVYAARVHPKAGVAPTGSVVTSGTVSDGSVEFTDLTEDTWYEAYALVDGQHRYLKFSTYTALPPAQRIPGLTEDLASKQPLMEKGDPDGYASLDSDGKVPASQLPAGDTPASIIQTFTLPGELSIGAGQSRFYLPTAGEIESIEASLGTSPTGQAVKVDVNKNGITLFTTQGNRPQVDPTAHTSGRKTPAVTALGQGDYLTVDVDQVGSEPTALPVHIGTEVNASAVGQYAISINRASLAAIGDYQLVSIAVQFTGATSPVVTPPSGQGWTQIGTDALIGAGLERTYQFLRKDDAAAGPWSFAVTGPASAPTIRAFSTLVRGVHATTPVDAIVQSTDTDGNISIAIPALTTTAADTLEVMHIQTNAAAGQLLIGAPSGYTVRVGFTSEQHRHGATIDRATATTYSATSLNMNRVAESRVTRVAFASGAAGGVEPGSDLTVVVRYTEA